MPPNPNRVTPEQAARNADQIIAVWAAGADSVRRCPAESFKYRETAERQRQEIDRLREMQRAGKMPLLMALNLDTLAKARRVAADYDRGQIEHLAGLVRRHASRFSTSHLMRALAVADRKVRNALVARAVRESWTLSALDRRVQIARGARRSGAGRRPFVPGDPDQCLVLLEGLCLRWRRWTAAAAADAELPGGVRRLVRDADAAVAAVQTVIAKHLPRGGPGPRVGV